MIQKYEINSDHFLGQARNQGENHRGPRKAKAKAKEILILRNRLAHPQKTYKLRRAMIEIGIPYNCFACGIDGSWNGQPLMLTVDHINGCRYDNRRENLRFLCPNCHSQTLTFGNSLGLTDVTTCKRRDKYYWQKRLAKG
jgi:predicted RNA-binding Zn-ribbon protein involved in translation (DUF1610 family)